MNVATGNTGQTASAQVLGQNDVLAKEREHLGLALPTDPAWALCLSGGGIRSATFALGVLQGLAKRGALSGFHFLSTVSGGGYIGSWLSRWIAEAGGSVTQVEKVLGLNTGPNERREPQQVRSLRAYSNYLSPVWGLSTDFFTLVSIFLRNLLLNWTVLIPLFAAVILVPRLYLGLAAPSSPMAGGFNAVLIAAALLVVLGIAYVVADLPSDAPNVGAPARRPRNLFVPLCFVPILGAAILLGLAARWKAPLLDNVEWWHFALAGAGLHCAGCVAGFFARLWRKLDAPASFWAGVRSGAFDFFVIAISGAIGGGIVYGLVFFLPQKFAVLKEARLAAVLAVPALLFSFWGATTAYIAFVQASENEREWWARSGGWWLRAALAWIAGFVLVIYLPQWVLFATGLNTSSLLTAGGVWGAIIGAIGYWTKNGAKLAGQAESFAHKVGARLLDIAAVAFILALIVALSLGVDFGIRNFAGKDDQPGATLREFESSVRDAESALRIVESLSKAGGSGQVSSALDAASAGAVRAAEELRKSAIALQASPADTQKSAETTARLTDTVAKSGKALRGGSAAARNMEAAGSITSQATDALLRSASKPALSEAPLPGTYAARMASADEHLAAAAKMFGFLLLAGVVMSVAVGVNRFSLHSMYGNRLVRAYFGAARPAENRRPHWFTGFEMNDNIDMAALQQPASQPRRLFHVVNLALNLVAPSGSRLEWQQRKAASFTVSPLHSGSDVLGYQDSETYSGGISLGRAMTISGAAAASNMGYHSSAPVAFVMTFFNARLGWWLPNPGIAGKRAWTKSEPRGSLRPLLWEAFGQTTDSKPYVYLSDGGHFDNLGLYEMVRRNCRRILVVDASADPHFGYDDLQDVMRKIRVDFGVSIEFPAGSLDRSRRCAVANIRYGDAGRGEDGKLFYLKPTLCGDEPLDVRYYADQSAAQDGTDAFPHQSTADQFFNEMQFESYRMLGAHTVDVVFGQDMKWPEDDPLAIQAAEAFERLRRAGAATAAAAEETAGAAAAQAKEGSAFSSALQSMGRGAMMATAITVGGVVGVTGTVALKDSTVELKPGAELPISSKSIQDLSNVTLNVAPVQMDPMVVALREDLSRSLNELVKVLDTQNQRGPQFVKVAEITQIIDASVKSTMAINSTELKALNTSIVNMIDVIKSMKNPGQADEAVRTSLVEIQKTLSSIDRSVAGVQPRRNVRGIEGGER